MCVGGCVRAYRCAHACVCMYACVCVRVIARVCDCMCVCVCILYTCVEASTNIHLNEDEY